MTRDEAMARTNAATDRIRKADPFTLIVVSAVVFASYLFRGAVHVCIGFGSASMAGVSMWWGFPMALLSGATLGRLLAFARRTSRVRGFEAAADDAEARAAKAAE